jgi:curved DNA-binding protein CbpA
LNITGDPMKNYYKVLDVDPKADEKTIKSAFYAQSKKLHPDVTPDDELAPDKFKELVEAYEVLGDTKKRQEYDNVLGTNSKEENGSSAQGLLITRGISILGWRYLYSLLTYYSNSGFPRGLKKINYPFYLNRYTFRYIQTPIRRRSTHYEKHQSRFEWYIKSFTAAKMTNLKTLRNYYKYISHVLIQIIVGISNIA